MKWIFKTSKRLGKNYVRQKFKNVHSEKQSAGPQESVVYFLEQETFILFLEVLEIPGRGTPTHTKKGSNLFYMYELSFLNR